MQTASADLSAYAARRLFRPSCPVDVMNHLLQKKETLADETQGGEE